MIEECWGALFSTDIFADEASISPLLVAPSYTVKGIFDLPYISVDGTESRDFTFTANADAFTLIPVRGDTFLLRTIEYLVITAEFDSTGKVLSVMLEEK